LFLPLGLPSFSGVDAFFSAAGSLLGSCACIVPSSGFSSARSFSQLLDFSSLVVPVFLQV
jgi:hypothetical protein